MNNYSVKLLSMAYTNIDEIYYYIAKELHSEQSALNIVSELENAILSLEQLPYRGAKRKVGAYKNKGYRQLFVKNFIVIYRIDESKKEVTIVTIRYSKMEN